MEKIKVLRTINKILHNVRGSIKKKKNGTFSENI